MPSKTTPDGEPDPAPTRPKRLTNAVVQNAYRDAVRKQENVEYGLATRPERDLETARKFAALRDEPWKLRLAIEMAYFARSSDVGDIWPYDRFLKKLEAHDAKLPEGLLAQDAVAIVDREIERGNPKWHETNIVRPLSRRASSVAVGTRSLDVGDNDDGPTVAPPSTDDTALELANLSADLAGAANKLDELARERLSRAMECRQRNDAIGADNLEYWSKVLSAAALAARMIASAGPDQEMSGLEASISAIQEATDGDEHTQTGPETHPFLLEVARQIDPRIAASYECGRFCRDIAGELIASMIGTTADMAPGNHEGPPTPGAA